MRKDKSQAKTAVRARPCVLLALIFCAAVLVPSFLSASDPKDALTSLLEQMELSYAKVKDYQAVFHKQERLEGKLLPEETIQLKFRKPLNIYMNWIGERLKGQEALYVRGQYENKLIAHRAASSGWLQCPWTRMALPRWKATAIRTPRSVSATSSSK